MNTKSTNSLNINHLMVGKNNILKFKEVISSLTLGKNENEDESGRYAVYEDGETYETNEWLENITLQRIKRFATKKGFEEAEIEEFFDRNLERVIDIIKNNTEFSRGSEIKKVFSGFLAIITAIQNQGKSPLTFEQLDKFIFTLEVNAIGIIDRINEAYKKIEEERGYVKEKIHGESGVIR